MPDLSEGAHVMIEFMPESRGDLVSMRTRGKLSDAYYGIV